MQNGMWRRWLRNKMLTPNYEAANQNVQLKHYQVRVCKFTAFKAVTHRQGSVMCHSREGWLAAGAKQGIQPAPALQT